MASPLIAQKINQMPSTCVIPIPLNYHLSDAKNPHQRAFFILFYSLIGGFIQVFEEITVGLNHQYVLFTVKAGAVGIHTS